MRVVTLPFLVAARIASVVGAATTALAPAAQTLGVSPHTLAVLEAWQEIFRIPWSALLSWLSLPFELVWWEKLADLLALLSLTASALWAGAMLELTAPAEKRAAIQQRRMHSLKSGTFITTVMATGVAMLFGLDFLTRAYSLMERSDPGFGYTIFLVVAIFTLVVWYFSDFIVERCYTEAVAITVGDNRLHLLAGGVVLAFLLLCASFTLPNNLAVLIWLVAAPIAWLPWSVMLVYALRYNPSEFSVILCAVAAIVAADHLRAAL